MEFSQPENFVWMWLVPLWWFLYAADIWRRQKRLRLFAHPKNLRALAPSYSKERILLKAVLGTLGLSSLVVALAGPRWGFEWQEVKRKGVDIMVALDVSQSMKAEDIKPNRLDRARREIIDLIHMLKGDRIGLIAFAGVGFVQCPLTTDYKAVQMFLDHLDADLIPVAGTSLGDAIALGIKSLSESSEGSSAGKAIILITDGEDQNSNPLAKAEQANKANIKVFTIGMGNQSGAPIPLADGGFKKDRHGNLIVTKLDDSILAKIADITGASYVRSTTGDLDLKRIYLEGIKGGGLEEAEISASRQKIWYERAHLFAALGFAMFLLLFFVRETVAQ